MCTDLCTYFSRTNPHLKGQQLYLSASGCRAWTIAFQSNQTKRGQVYENKYTKTQAQWAGRCLIGSVRVNVPASKVPVGRRVCSDPECPTKAPRANGITLDKSSSPSFVIGKLTPRFRRLRFGLNPNSPMDPDGGREDRGREVRELQAR